MRPYSLVAHIRRAAYTKNDSSDANVVSRLAEIAGGRMGVRGAQKQKTAFIFWADGRQWEGRYAVQRYAICEGASLGARSEWNDREDEERTLSRIVTESVIYTLLSESR